jgi:hypothetical protein
MSDEQYRFFEKADPILVALTDECSRRASSWQRHAVPVFTPKVQQWTTTSSCSSS